MPESRPATERGTSYGVCIYLAVIVGSYNYLYLIFSDVGCHIVS